MHKLPVISTKGKPFARGQQYGTQARQLIRRNVEIYFDMWANLWNARRPAILKKSKELATVIGEYDAEIFEELEGIARGADLSLAEIVALNSRYEINFSFGLGQDKVMEGCTSVIALPSVTRSGHTLIGQNWDWLPRFQEFNIILQEDRVVKVSQDVVFSTTAYNEMVKQIIEYINQETRFVVHPDKIFFFVKLINNFWI